MEASINKEEQTIIQQLEKLNINESKAVVPDPVKPKEQEPVEQII